MPQLWVRNAVAEGIGAFALTFVAIMTIATGGLTPYALAQGVIVLALVAALGHVSGGHFNPAVTLGLLLGRRIDVVGAVMYWAAQLIGGIVAAVVVLLVMSRDVVASAAPDPAAADELHIAGAVALEGIAVFVLVLVVFGTIVDQRAPLSAYPFAIGLAYTGGILAIGGLTGGALNPARGFGPAVVSGEWGGTLSWLVGPLLGAVLAWAVFEFVIGAGPDVAVPDDASTADASTGADVRGGDAPSGDEKTASTRDDKAAVTGDEVLDRDETVVTTQGRSREHAPIVEPARPSRASLKVGDSPTARFQRPSPAPGGAEQRPEHRPDLVPASEPAEPEPEPEPEPAAPQPEPGEPRKPATPPPPPPPVARELPPEHKGLLDD